MASTSLISAILPATKEQRDLLFQKMKEAGYEWNAEKKELKKIEQKATQFTPEQADILDKHIDKFVEHNAWNEEDKFCIQALLHYCEQYQIKDSDRLRCLNWLKFLKDRIQPQIAWEPSDESMLNTIANSLDRWQVEHVWHTTIEEVVDRLKSFKYRLQPKLKRELSDKDYNELETIACHLDNINNEGMAESLRIIRDKYYSQPAWKPSKEQMEVLKLSTNCPSEQMSKVLLELYQDLKKLKEE